MQESTDIKVLKLLKLSDQLESKKPHSFLAWISEWALVPSTRIVKNRLEEAVYNNVFW